MFTEIKETTSTLAELSKGYETLSNRELNKSLDYFSRSLDNFQEGILPNKEEGLRREAEVEEELEKKYSESEGCEIVSEAYLRDSEGKIVRDPEAGAETAAETVSSGPEILGDGLSEEAISEKGIVESVEKPNTMSKSNLDIIGDGIGETSLENNVPEMSSTVDAVSDSKSDIIGDGVDETSLEKADNKDLSDKPVQVDKVEGLSDQDKERIKKETGWSDEIVDHIKTPEEANVYKEAGLKEVNGNLERTDIDWNAKIPQDRIDRMRSLYGKETADKWAGKTNMDLIKEGKAPYGPDGEQINLHHIGQKADSPLAELTDTEHKKNDAILHDKTKSSEINRPVFRLEREAYWKNKYIQMNKNNAL